MDYAITYYSRDKKGQFHSRTTGIVIEDTLPAYVKRPGLILSVARVALNTPCLNGFRVKHKSGDVKFSYFEALS